MSVFSVSREGGWEFHPFLRAALPTLLSLRSPTQTLGYLHGYSGSKTPENIAQQQYNVCYLVVTQNMILHTRVRTCDLQTLPRLCFEPDRDKKERLTSISLLDVNFSFDQIAQFFIGVQVNTCAQWQRLFHVSVGECVCVPDV